MHSLFTGYDIITFLYLLVMSCIDHSLFIASQIYLACFSYKVVVISHVSVITPSHWLTVMEYIDYSISMTSHLIGILWCHIFTIPCLTSHHPSDRPWCHTLIIPFYDNTPLWCPTLTIPCLWDHMIPLINPCQWHHATPLSGCDVIYWLFPIYHHAFSLTCSDVFHWLFPVFDILLINPLGWLWCHIPINLCVCHHVIHWMTMMSYIDEFQSVTLRHPIEWLRCHRKLIFNTTNGRWNVNKWHQTI